MKINTKSVEPIDVCILHITLRDNKKDSFERSTKCGTELTLTNISMKGMGQTSRPGQPPRASRHDTAGHKPLQNSELHKHRHR